MADNFVDIDDTVTKYKKPAKRVHHKKSDHTHRYDFCVYEYDFPASVPGRVTTRELSIGTYCPLCGKVGARFTRDAKYAQHTNRAKNHFYLGYEWNEEALKQFNVSTRTLPCFFLDHWADTKYVKLHEVTR